MKKLAGLLFVASMSLVACAYQPGGVSADGHVVLVKNNGILFGLLNKIFVCQVTPAGLSGCAAAEQP